LISKVLERVKRKVLLMGFAQKDLRVVKNWNKGTFTFGPTITGDVGHQVQADATMVQYGVKTRSRWAAELGSDFKDLARESAAEIEVLKALAEKKGIPIELLVQSMGGATEQLAAMAKAQSGVPDGPPPPPGLIGQVGDKGAAQILDLLASVGRGEVDPQSGRMTLQQVYGLDPAVAMMIIR
jgi:hypothetical protein